MTAGVAAILTVDVVAYSRPMSEDGQPKMQASSSRVQAAARSPASLRGEGDIED
jgi:hypothetical protein